MNAEELLTGEKAVSWVSELEPLREAFNKVYTKSKKEIELKEVDKYASPSTSELLMEGTKVRVALDAPIDIYNRKKLHGKFRSSDIRWNPDIKEIKTVSLNPGNAPSYLVSDDTTENGYSRRAYTKNELQVVDEKNDQLPPKSVIRIKKQADIIRDRPDNDHKEFYMVNLDNQEESKLEMPSRSKRISKKKIDRDMFYY
jgi:hypothetical protein